MASINQIIEMFSGESKLVNVTVKNSDGTVVNLTGATIKWVVKTSTGTISKDTVNGITISNPTLGEFTITLNPIDTSSMSGNYSHEARVTDAIGNVSTILTGTIRVNTSQVV